MSEFFGQYNEGSGADFGNCSDTSQHSQDDNSIEPDNVSLDGESSVSTKSQTTAEPALSKCKVPSIVASKGTTSVVVGVFHFMQLPLSVREKIHKCLLVVPAIICVKQKQSVYHDEKKAFLYAERRELLPGIAYALTQSKVDGLKSRFSRSPNTNPNILRVSKEIFSEARAVMYGSNTFDIVKPSNELMPEPDYSIPLFPPRYHPLVTKLSMRIRTSYDLDWLLSGGHNIIKNYYRGLRSLTLVLEMDSVRKWFGQQWARKSDEEWTAYIERLRGELAHDLFENTKTKRAVKIPTLIHLQVPFRGEAHDGGSGALTDIPGVATADNMTNERARREELRSALVEAWELLRKISR